MLTTVLNDTKEPLRVEREVLVPLATPSAVEALVETPGIARVNNATALRVET